MTGTWTNLTSTDLKGTNATVNPPDKPQVNLEGGITSFNYRRADTLDQQADLTYTSAGQGTVRIYGLPTKSTVVAVTDNGDQVATAATGESGTAELTLPDRSSKEVVRLQLT
jgi:hypothetical protein